MWQKIKNIYHLGNAILANLWFGFPSRSLTVIGVTGTDGKTTTTSLIYHILHTAGYSASMISSVGAIIGGKEYDIGFHVTTPSPWALQRFIKKSVTLDALRSLRQFGDSSTSNVNQISSLARANFSKTGSEDALFKSSPHAKAPRASNYLILEVTSHAIDQNRIWGIQFDIGVLTNITHEHLDYHKTYENYVITKMKLLQKSKISVINKDDVSYKIISSKLKTASFAKASAAKQNSKLITYGMKSDTDVNPENFPFKTNLIGEFNKYNILAAISACRELEISDEAIREAILTFKPPIGRGEIVYPSARFAARRASSGQVNFTVMVDFAHTPNAFEEILSSIKPSIKGTLIHVFGSAGLRDVSKRPLMGKSSAKYSDVIILTAEDPRSESVEEIMEEIISGIDDRRWKVENGNRRLKIENRIFKIADRQEAITAAIGMARKGDFVIITGKSHEKSMNYGKGEEPWDEFGAVKNALSSLRK